MAQRRQILLEDDLDGGRADETVRFGLDGIDYDIDLSKRHAKQLRGAFATYTAAGRRVAGRRVTGRRMTGRGPGAPSMQSERAARAAQIRAWAAEHGWELDGRGRLPVRVVEAYTAATTDSA